VTLVLARLTIDRQEGNLSHTLNSRADRLLACSTPSATAHHVYETHRSPRTDPIIGPESSPITATSIRVAFFVKVGPAPRAGPR
jgi:hypothetical protein